MLRFCGVYNAVLHTWFTLIGLLTPTFCKRLADWANKIIMSIPTDFFFTKCIITSDCGGWRQGNELFGNKCCGWLTVPVAVCSVFSATLNPMCKGGGQGGPSPSSYQSHKQKCVFNKRTIKVCVSCSWRCPGASAPSWPHLTVSLFLCNCGSNARGEARALEGRRVS